MSHLSIFSFNTLSLRVRKLLPCLLLTLGFSAILDCGARHYQPIKLFGGWENPYVQMQLDGARQMYKRHGKLDVLLMGSSIGTHIDVGRWTEAFGEKVICFDAAMGGQHPQWANFVFRNVLYPSTRPKHLLYVVCPRDLNGPSFSRPEARYNGALFESVNARRFLADTFMDKIASSLERVSYLFSSRRHVRRYLQQGPIPQDPIYPLLQTGSNPPTVRWLTGEGPITPAEKAKLRSTNHYANLNIPPDGELGELLQLAKFCKSKGVGFTLVNQPVAPATQGLYDDYERDYKKYLAALQFVRDAGFTVVDMAADVPVKNRQFSDFDHPNRWGSQLFTDYIFRKVLRPLNPEYALVENLVPSAEVHFYDLVSRTVPDFFSQDRSRIPPVTNYASPLQIATTWAGGRIPIKATLPAGKYLLDLYGVDERTTRTGSAPEHQLSWEITSSEGNITKVPFGLSRQNVQGETLTRLEVDLPASASIALNIEKLGGPECVIDSVFIRRKIASAQRQLDVSPLLAASKVSDPFIFNNPDFEHLSARRVGLPSEWEPYTQDRKPWGEVSLSTDAQHGKKAVYVQYRKEWGGWGCMIIQRVHESVLESLRGKKITISFHAKSEGKAVAAALTSGQKTEVKFQPYTMSGVWQKLQAQVSITSQTNSLQLAIGSLSPDPVWIDNVTVTYD